MTQVLVADLLTGRRILNVPFNTLSWTKPRNAAETMSCTIPLASRALRKLDLQNATTPAKTMLAVIENDVVMAAGPIWSRRWDDDSKVLTVGAAGMWSYFDHRHDTGANKTKSLAIYAHYNMDAGSNARPFLSSPHRYGFCADIADSRFLAWLKSPDPHRPGHNIAARYGLVFTLLKENDLRHAQFFPGTATAALDVTSLSGDAQNPTAYMEDDMKFIKVMLNPDPNASHYLGVVIGPNGIVDTIDVQAGWDPAKGPFTPNPLYLAYELAFAAGLPVASYTFSNAQFATLQAGIARWPKAAGAGPVSFPTDYATSAAVAAVGAKVDALPAAIVKAEGSALLNG